MGWQQLYRAILLRHLLAMEGNVELIMALGYRHLYSATSGSTLVLDLIADDKTISTGYVAESFVIDTRILSAEPPSHGIQSQQFRTILHTAR